MNATLGIERSAIDKKLTAAEIVESLTDRQRGLLVNYVFRTQKKLEELQAKLDATDDREKKIAIINEQIAIIHKFDIDEALTTFIKEAREEESVTGLKLSARYGEDHA
ncbi:MAG: hypothetical protein ABIG61_07570 [Planctomycetota bacterium]